MDKSKDRLEKITNNLNSLGLKFNRFSAVNGKNLSNEEIEKNTTWICRNLLCNYGIVGCAMSHISLWKQLLTDDTTDKYIILEDDAILSKESVNILNKIESYIDKYDINYLNLFCDIYPSCTILKTEFTIDKYNFGKPVCSLQTCGYIINKKGAKKILEVIDKIKYHIDIQLSFENFFQDLNIYSSSPTIISCSDDITTIGNDYNSLTIKILHGIGLKKLAWQLNSPQLTIKMFFVINIIFIILVLLFVINKTKIKSNILNWFLILEFYLYFSIYF